jgi:DNA-binding IclR family transcriptional regulator
VTGRRATIQSVERAARILKALGTGAPRLGVTEIADRLGIAKATVYGLVRTLEQQELVEQDAETGKYRLGPAMLQLGNAFLEHHELRSRSLLWADSLASRVGEAVRVGVLHGRTVLIVHHVFRPDDTVQVLEVGAAIPWHASALGKAAAAFLDADRRRTLLAGALPRLTGRTIAHPHELAGVLDRAALDGVAREDQEAVLGEAGIAAPIFDHRGHPVGAIGVVGPADRLHPGVPAEEIVAAVKDAARGVSREMGAGRLASRGVEPAGPR